MARGGPGGSSISVTTDVLSARMRVFDHLEGGRWVLLLVREETWHLERATAGLGWGFAEKTGLVLSTFCDFSHVCDNLL